MNSGERRRSVWRRPLQLALLTAVGLVAALLGNGPWRVVAWGCLVAPLLTGLKYLTTRGSVERALQASHRSRATANKPARF